MFFFFLFSFGRMAILLKYVKSNLLKLIEINERKKYMIFSYVLNGVCYSRKQQLKRLEINAELFVETQKWLVRITVQYE